MEFNFDSENNIKVTKVPSIKVLNADAKLWISDENVEICGWKGDLIPHILETGVSGNIIYNPRMLILQRSLLLKVETNTGRTVKVWSLDDKKDETYTCVRKYLILFVDENNNPLHEVPLQLTAKGCFQFEFDKQLYAFRAEMLQAYNEDKRKNALYMKQEWYSMCVFVPTFKSMMRGEGNKQKKACITTHYEKPTKENWKTFCVGTRTDSASVFWPGIPASVSYCDYIFQLFNETKKVCERKGWWKRY
jgi:hypothetical protein